MKDERLCQIFLDARVQKTPPQFPTEDVAGANSRRELCLACQPLAPVALLRLGRNPKARCAAKYDTLGQTRVVAVQKRGVVTRQKVNLEKHAHHLSDWADAA